MVKDLTATGAMLARLSLGRLQISSNFALARSLSANQGREIAQNRNIDPRDSVVKDLRGAWRDHRFPEPFS